MNIIEILIIIAIIGIMTAIAIPLWRNFTPTAKLNSARSQLISALQQAKQKAITQNRNVFFDVQDDFALEEGLIWQEITFPGEKIKFRPSGAVLKNGKIVIESTKNNKTATIEVRPSGYIR